MFTSQNTVHQMLCYVINSISLGWKMTLKTIFVFLFFLQTSISFVAQQYKNSSLFIILS